MKSKISFQARATGPDLSLSVILNGQIIDTLNPYPEFHKIEVEVDDSIEQAHVLELCMSGKKEEHTRIDDQGNILEDQVIEVKDFSVEEIQLGHVFIEHARYTHDFNGTQSTIEETFYGTMGCNGVVKFEFSTPVYLWLLENI